MDTLSDVEIAAILDCIVYNDNLVDFTKGLFLISHLIK